MAKFRSPFNTNEVWITQTHHTQSNNTAVDFSAVAETPVYAMADGTVTYRSSGAGSYCIQTLDNSDLKIYYVHTHRWVATNTYVKKGQIICYIAPTSVNGGYPTHLHCGLPVGKFLMDYMDRNIVFRTKYQAIKDIWFIGENLNWSKHKDLSYESNTMKIGDNVELSADTNLRVGSGTSYNIKTVVVKGAVGNIIGGSRNADGYEWWDVKFTNDQGWMANPLGTRLVKTTKQITQTDGKLPTPPIEPPVDPQPTECEKQITTLNNKIQALELTTEAQGGQINSLLSQNKTLADNMNRLSTEKSELSDNLEKLQIMFDGLQGSYNILEKEKLNLQEELSRCKLELQEGKTNFIKKILDAIKKWLDSTVG